MAHHPETSHPPADLHTPDPAVVKEMKASIRRFIKVAAALFVGTVLTVAVAPIDFGGHSINVGIGLLIATVKASLVALIFMHLNHERGLMYKVLLFRVVFFAAMMFLFVLHHYDPIHHSSYPK